MRLLQNAAIALMVTVLVGCGSAPLAPATAVRLTVVTNFSSVITVTTPDGVQGNIDVTQVTVTVPTNTTVQIDVKRMDGQGTKSTTIDVEHDTMLNVDF